MVLLTQVDHLVYATPDLKAGIDELEEMLGVRATNGGRHAGLGTCNALLALGPDSYLEIIGPDPEQKGFPSPRPFGIDQLSSSRLVTWAARSAKLEQFAALDLGEGTRLGSVASGSRRTPEGVSLSWRFTDPRTVVADGIVPFLIEWGNTLHPAKTAASGATLIDLHAQHPEHERVQKMLTALGLELRVSRGLKAALVATIQTSRGRVELSS